MSPVFNDAEPWSQLIWTVVKSIMRLHDTVEPEDERDRLFALDRTPGMRQVTGLGGSVVLLANVCFLIGSRFSLGNDLAPWQAPY